NGLSKLTTKINKKSKLFLNREAPQILFPNPFNAWKMTHLVPERATDAYARERAVVMKATKESGVEVVVKSDRSLYDSDELVEMNGSPPIMTITPAQNARGKIGGVPRLIPVPKFIPDSGETPLDSDQDQSRQSLDFNSKPREHDEKSHDNLTGPNGDFEPTTLEEVGFLTTTEHRGGENLARRPGKGRCQTRRQR
ncbi:hypothetical protein BJ875DRAFT_376408, partial [Amylocarpus encephaloides]